MPENYKLLAAIAVFLLSYTLIVTEKVHRTVIINRSVAVSNHRYF